MTIKLPRKLVAGALAASIALSGALVAHFEGTRYTAYQDVTGTWTICDGHTRGVKAGDTATLQQCAAWRYEDL